MFSLYKNYYIEFLLPKYCCLRSSLSVDFVNFLRFISFELKNVKIEGTMLGLSQNRRVPCTTLTTVLQSWASKFGERFIEFKLIMLLYGHGAKKALGAKITKNVYFHGFLLLALFWLDGRKRNSINSMSLSDNLRSISALMVS